MNVYETRRDKLIEALSELGRDAVLIDSPSNLYYYTGFTGGEAMLFLFLDGCASMITDSRYYEQVEKECPDVTLVPMESKGYSELIKELLDNMCEEGLFHLSVEGKEYVKKRCAVAVESTMSLSRYLKLTDICSNCRFEIADDAIMECRMVKDDTELENIRKAEAIGDAAFSHILDRIRPGVMEAEIALELEFFMKRQGASKLSFDTIVASGPNSSMPHAQVTNRRIENGDFVTMDFGCVYQGYCSDMTRTIAVGNPSEEMKKVYQIVLDANLRAMEGVREGVRCNAVDALARDYIKEQGYGAYFGHGLGHGVGLDIHEEPRFSPKCDVLTKENMVITDEPGIYLPGQFGVRIEDLLVVKKDGYEKLSQSEKQLIVL